MASFLRQIVARRVHLDLDVRGGRGIVPKGQRPVAVQQTGDDVGIGLDAGDVRGGGEAADQQLPVAVELELTLQMVEVDSDRWHPRR